MHITPIPVKHSQSCATVGPRSRDGLPLASLVHRRKLVPNNAKSPPRRVNRAGLGGGNDANC